jgi:nicotinamide riboside kinase
MIVVVEGISAAGKTTWCQQHAAQYLIRESYPDKRPNRQAGPGEAARIWTDWNSRRWSEAVAMERAHGVAVCDTDPLKLHFIWAMWQIGEVAEPHWIAQLKFTRQAFYDQRLGFADRYLFKKISPDVAQAQRDHDASRSRPNFDLHLRLSNSLVLWYETLATVIPCLVRWELPDGPPQADDAPNPFRYDVSMFDRFVQMLPRPRR